jgi:hypothetical protein
VADERGEVDRGANLPDPVEGFTHVEGRPATVPRDDRRHSHPHEVLGARMLGKVVGVRVDVDEAGRNDEARRVDDLTRVGFRYSSNRCDAAVLDRHVCASAGRTGAVHNHPADDREVVAGLGPSGRGGRYQQDADNDQGDSVHVGVIVTQIPPPDKRRSPTRGQEIRRRLIVS